MDLLEEQLLQDNQNTADTTCQEGLAFASQKPSSYEGH